jgi:signal peptide peptidase SppA
MNRIQLATLLQQPLCVSPEYVQALLPVVSSILNGTETKLDFSEERKTMIPVMQSPNGAVSSWEINKAPAGSVLIVRLKGPVLKDSQLCGPVGTVELANQINEAKGNSNIIGAVIRVESGGGAMYAVKPLADSIKIFRQEKPIITLGEDILASAAYYIASYCNEIMVDNTKSMIGSIGTMISFQDIQPALEKLGVNFHDIYATESTAKNKDFKEALAGNYNSIIKKRLDPINQDFIADVKSNREGLISTSEKLIFQGETWFASVAKELGMIDSLGSIADAVERIRFLSENPTPKSTQKTNMKFTNLTALAGVENPTTEQIDLANTDLTAAGITGVTVVAESFITDAAQATTDLASANATVVAITGERDTAVTSLATATASITSKDGEISTLKAQVAAFGANAGTNHVAQVPPGEEQANAADTDYDAIMDSLPHNQKADKMFG